MQYDKSITSMNRIKTFFKWIDDDPELAMITLYFSMIDDAGHRFGPESPQMTSELMHLDRLVAELKSGLEQRGLYKRANLIILSDHGLAQAIPPGNVEIDKYVPSLKDKILWMDYNSVTSVFPKPGRKRFLEC